MLKQIILSITIITLVSCSFLGRTAGTDFIRNFKETKGGLFKENDRIIFLRLESSNMVFIDKNAGILKDEDPNHQEIKEDILSQINYDTSRYESTSSFLVSQYNNFFSLGLSEGSYDSKFDGSSMRGGLLMYQIKDIPKKKLIVSDISVYDVIQYKIIYKKMTTKSKQYINVIEPEDISQFCDEFSTHYPNCDYLILMKDFFFSNVPLTNSISYSLSNTPGPIFLIPKTIIDIKNKKVVAYDLNQTFTEIPSDYDNNIVPVLLDRYQLEGLRLNYFL